MAGTTPIYGLPYPQSGDLVSAYPALGQDLAEDLDDILADKYSLKTVVYFTSSGTFTKASYANLKAIRVRCVGGGGGSGGCATAAVNQVSVGAGGGGGAYAETWITDIAGLAASVTVTVGAGGAAGATPGAGGAGGNTSFGTLCVANGGGGGGTSGASAAPPQGATGGTGGSVGTADFGIPGANGGYAWAVATNNVITGFGGSSALGFGGNNSLLNQTGQVSIAGQVYGGGAGGSSRANNAGGALAGAAGAAGIVIVEVYQR